MEDAIRPATRAGVTFEVERLEREGDELIVSGHWSGLRGVRFVRPTLMVGKRRVLATLEHKPWTPRADRAWTAAFPWKDDGVADQLTLVVAPSLTVPLCPAAKADEPLLALVSERAAQDDPAPPPPSATVAQEGSRPRAAPPSKRQRGAPATPARKHRRRLERELEAAAQERDALRLQLDEAQGMLDGAQVLIAVADAERVQLEARLHYERRAAAEAAHERDEVQRARTAAERSRDLALAQRDDSVLRHEAATRARIEHAYEEAVQARAGAAAAVAVAEVERARAERDEAAAQREKILLAYRALQRQVHAERAAIARSQPAVGADEPAGAQAMPATQAMPAMQGDVSEPRRRPRPSTSVVASIFDAWGARVLGTVATACFVFLLASVTRIFL